MKNLVNTKKLKKEVKKENEKYDKKGFDESLKRIQDLISKLNYDDSFTIFLLTKDKRAFMLRNMDLMKVIDNMADQVGLCVSSKKE